MTFFIVLWRQCNLDNTKFNHLFKQKEEIVVFSQKQLTNLFSMESKNDKRIKVTENRPYEVTGDISLDQLRFIPNNHENSLKYKKIDSYPVENRYYLCRCGKSTNKLFYDGNYLRE